MATTEFGGWVRTPWYHDGSPVYRNERTGEFAAEALQEGCLLPVAADVAAALRFLADFDRALDALTGGTATR